MIALIIAMIAFTAFAEPIDWTKLQPGDVVTLRTDAAAVNPPAYALPPGVMPQHPDGIFFGDFFVGVTGKPYMHMAMYVGNDTFITADGAGSAIGAMGGVYLAPTWFIQFRAVDQPLVH